MSYGSLPRTYFRGKTLKSRIPTAVAIDDLLACEDLPYDEDMSDFASVAKAANDAMHGVLVNDLIVRREDETVSLVLS